VKVAAIRDSSGVREFAIIAAMAAIGLALLAAEVKVVPFAPEAAGFWRPTLAAAFGAVAAYRTAGEARMPQATVGFASCVLGCLAAVVSISGMLAWLAAHASGPVQLLCIVGAVLPPIAATAGWRAARPAGFRQAPQK